MSSFRGEHYSGQQSYSLYSYDSTSFYYPIWSGSTYEGGSPWTGTLGKQLTENDYDYGGSLLKTTNTSYYYQVSGSAWLANLLAPLNSVQINDSGGTQRALTYYTYDSDGVARGNPYQTQRWLNTTGSYLTTTTTYDSYGRLTSVKDPKNNTTTFSYGSCYAGSGPTAVTNALNQTTSFCYDFNTGLQTSVTDPNSQTTSTSYDGMLRTQSINYPDTGQTSFNYPSSTEVDITELMDHQGGARHSSLLMDGIGREIARGTSNGDSGYDETDTCYDGNGRVLFKSYPYKATSIGVARSCTESGDTFAYDPLSRTASVTHSDNSAVSTSYYGNSATVTDEQGKTRESFMDGLGRLTTVIENPGGLNYSTTYSYDALDNLTGVTQVGSRQRSFVYDSLSRLTGATNPESGTTNYSYDAAGNVITKTDGRGIVTCYGNWSGLCDGTGYDVLNRPTQKTYSDQSEIATYGYDVSSQFGISFANPVGRMVFEKLDYPGSGPQNSTWSTFSYDSMGRIASQGNCFPSPIAQCQSFWTVGVSYDLLGDISSLAYPDGRVVKTTYDPAARPIQTVFDNYQGTYVGYNYLSAAHYAADGSPTNVTLGNGVTEASTYNSRMQPCNQQIATGLSTWVNRTYSFYASPTCSGTGGNNGNVMQIADNLQSGRTQNFTYDPVNRLATAATQATSGPDCWGNSFGYDQWGNLLQQNVSQCSAPYMNLSVDTGNHITNSGFAYDAAGNLTLNGPITYQYDAENRLVNYASGAGVYTYDAKGNRVQKQAGGVTTDYIYFGGQPIAEYNPATGDWSDYIYAGGHRLARADTFWDGLETSGTNCTSCGWQYTVAYPSSSSVLNGYVIQNGDVLSVRQWQQGGAEGGLTVDFTDSTGTNWNTYDQDGQIMNSDTTQNAWHVRHFDLSSYAGKAVSDVHLVTDGYTPGGQYWTVYYLDIVLVSADGTVRPVFNGQPGVSLNVSATSGVSNPYGAEIHVSGQGQYPDLTQYYHSDHIGSARLLTSYAGYPTYSGTFLPFGEEWNPQITVNHYKFTGKEHDDESGLDNFGARYFTSTYGRFMTTDPTRASVKPTNPQTWNRYAYALNSPLSYIDDNGLWPTRIHNEIYELAFGGRLTDHQIEVIEDVSASRDSILGGGQSPAHANWHSQCSPGQQDCQASIASLINGNLAAAKAFGEREGLSDEALYYFTIADHAAIDSGSPMHTDARGFPTTWKGIWPNHWIGDIGHYLGENDESDSWWGIGVSVRKSVNDLFNTFGDSAVEATRGGNAQDIINLTINSMVDQYFGGWNGMETVHDAARACALGNPAACLP